MPPLFRAIGLTLVLAAPAFADEPGAADATFFEQKIRPLLAERCYSCHSEKEKKTKGGLALDSRAGWQKGGASGPALTPKKPDESRIIQAVRYGNPDMAMPPKGKLTGAEIALLEEWVARGAPDPRDSAAPVSKISPEAARQHWAFQPIRNPAIPIVKDRDWPLDPMDHFLLARLEHAGLKPAAGADRSTWLRRVSLDLTGLPPSPADIAAFLADTSPSAHERVVDRLLGSRAYAERWARHWLDLVGYADQIGTANDVFAEHAWRYRDFLIRSLAADVPWDRLVRQQIAGDLLPWSTPQERADNLIATGFLVLHHVDIVEADLLKLRVDVVDQQVEKVGAAFLGLTLQCARCHDHKFDPVTLHDYYAVAGTFHSTQSTFPTGRGVWSDVIAAELPETPSEKTDREARAKAHADHVAKLKSDLAEAEKQLAAATEKKPLEDRIASLKRAIPHAEFFSPRVPRTFAVRDRADVGDMRVTIRGNPRALGETVPRGVVAVLGAGPAIPATESGRRQLAEWLVDPANPLPARVAVNRVWQKLFGEGVVRSVDYFGLRGETPSHPELLDHLATRFRGGGGSQKALLRAIVLSRAYRMGNVGEPNASRLDPDNRLVSRMPGVRLDAEAIRDSVLAASGQLRAWDGGPAMPLEFPENVGNLAKTDVNPPMFRFAKFRPEQNSVRTIYLPVVRSLAQPGPADIRNDFDFPQPAQFAGKRAVTTTPTQSLFLMNSPLVKTAAETLAKDVLGSQASVDERIDLLWMRVLNRPPSPEERADAAAFVQEGDPRAWTMLAQTLFMAGDFLIRS